MNKDDLVTELGKLKDNQQAVIFWVDKDGAPWSLVVIRDYDGIIYCYNDDYSFEFISTLDLRITGNDSDNFSVIMSNEDLKTTSN